MPRNLDAELERIRKRSGNKQCPNCAAEEREGFRNFICKFEQIVCSNCKMAHQAFSHRCKGVGMSTFTEEEVDRMNVTSNVIAGGTWLGKLSRKEICRMAPTKVDKPEAWHKWIQRIYLNKEFYVAGGRRDKRKKKKGSKGTKKQEVLPSSSSDSDSDSSDDEAAKQAAEAQTEADRKAADEHNRQKRAAEAKRAAGAEAAKAAAARVAPPTVPGVSSSSESESSSSEDEATKRRKRKEAAKASKAAEKAAAKAAKEAAKAGKAATCKEAAKAGKAATCKEAAKAGKAATCKEAAKAGKKPKKSSIVPAEGVEASAGTLHGADELSLEELLLGPPPLGRSVSDGGIAGHTQKVGPAQPQTSVHLGRSTSDGALSTAAIGGAAPMFDLAAWAANGDDSD